MEHITLKLPQYDIYCIACLQLGRFFADDSTPEECMAYWDNVSSLRGMMDEKHSQEFIKVSTAFQNKRELIKNKAGVLFDKLSDDLNELFGW